MKTRYTFICLFFVFAFFQKTFTQGSTFNFTNSGTTAQIDSALDFTGKIWGDYLNSTVPIKVNVYFAFLGVGTTLAITLPNGERDFTSAPLDSVWYPSCLANSLQGVELNPGEADMDIFVNNTVNWYFGTDAICPASKYDFVSVMLHEIGHGLGFLSLAKMQDTTGSFGNITLADIAPITTSFPFPNLGGKFSAFSSFMENGTGQALYDSLIFQNQSVAMADQFVSNSIYFNGPLSLIQNGGSPVRLYAPTTYEPGSSMEHLNESTFPANNTNTLMTPFISATEEHHTPGLLAIAMLQDMGWSVNYDVGFENILTDMRMCVFPNPVKNEAYIALDQNIENEKVEIFDMYGKVVFASNISVAKGDYYLLNLSTLATGVYTVQIKDGLFKMIKN